MGGYKAQQTMAEVWRCARVQSLVATLLLFSAAVTGQDGGVPYGLADTQNDPSGSGDPTPTDNTEGEGGSLNIGVVVGIAIAAIILIIALVGLAIYCFLRNRQEEFKDAEANDGRSGTSVFTSNNSQVMFAGGGSHRRGVKTYGSTEDVRSSSDKGSNQYSNKGYHADGDERFNRDGSYRREKGGQRNLAFDESDHAVERGGHVSRRDSGRDPSRKKNFTRTEEFEMSKVSKTPNGRESKVPNGILKTRSKSPNRSNSSTEGSTVDSNALVYGYGHQAHAHPNTQHIPVLERTRSRSRSRGASSHRSGSTGRSRSGSVGKSAGKDVKTGRQYSDMSHFLDKPKQRPRSRSGSMGRRPRSDSKNSDTVPSEVSFAPSGTSSKKNTGGRRVHIQSVETDF